MGTDGVFCRRQDRSSPSKSGYLAKRNRRCFDRGHGPGGHGWAVRIGPRLPGDRQRHLLDHTCRDWLWPAVGDRREIREEASIATSRPELLYRRTWSPPLAASQLRVGRLRCDLGCRRRGTIRGIAGLRGRLGLTPSGRDEYHRPVRAHKATWRAETRHPAGVSSGGTVHSTYEGNS